MDDEYLLAPDPALRSLPDPPTPERFSRLASLRWPTLQVAEPVPPVAAVAWLADDDGADAVIDLHPDGRTLTITSLSQRLVGEIAVWWAGVWGADVSLWLFDTSMAGYSIVRADSNPVDLL